MVGETEEITCETRDEAEDIVTSSGSEDEESDDELNQQAHNYSVPLNVLAAAGCGVEDRDEDHKAEEANGSVGASVVFGFFADERSGEDDCYNHECG